MKVIIECDCGNRVELKPVTQGKIVYFESELSNHKFSIFEKNINVNKSCWQSNIDKINESSDMEESEIADLVDVDTELKSIRINCNNCNNNHYIVLEF